MNFTSPIVHAEIWREQTIFGDVWAESGAPPDYIGVTNYYLYLMNFTGRVYDPTEIVDIPIKTFPTVPKRPVEMDALNTPPREHIEPTDEQAAEYYLQVMNFIGKPIGGL